MMARVAAAFLSIWIVLGAHGGTLTTRDGQTYSGLLRLGERQVTLTTESGPRAFDLSSVALADFKAKGAEAVRPGHGLFGEYFVGRGLKRLLLTRVDPALDYDWRQSLPHPSVAPFGREFSVRWTGQLRADRSEPYTFIVNSDDGIRVWLDGQVIIDRWFDSVGETSSKPVTLEKDRKYDLRVEYYNGHDDAYAALYWQSAGTPREAIGSDDLYLPSNATTAPATTQAIAVTVPSSDGGPAFRRVFSSDTTGLKGEYYADRELMNLNFIRFDPNIDIHFHPDNPPDPAVSPEGSIRWSGMVEPRFSEEYRFHAEVNRRVRLWIDDRLVIDQWRGEGGDYSSDKIPMVAGKKVPIRLEYTSPNGFMLCRLRWSSKSQGRDLIPADAFSIAPGERLGRPVVGMVYPAGDAFVAAPSSLALLATGLSPNGRIEKFLFYDRNSAICELGAQPFRFVWNKPRPGVYQLRAKVIDAAGVTSLSETSTLTITGKGDGSIKAPWGDFFIANNDSKTPGTASQKGADTFEIRDALGTLVSESEHDSGHFIVQPLAGDGQIVARVASVDPMDETAGAMAGVTIRENLKNRCKQFSMLLGQGAEEPQASFVRRQDGWMNPTSSDKAAKGPIWFKLARHGQRIYAYTSTDGKDWDLFAAERFDAPQQVFAGLVAFSRDTNRPAVAQFDHVRLIPGAPPLESIVKGFVTRGGTFVAATVYAIDENLVRYTRNNAQGSIRLNDVARILYKPLLVDHAAKLSPGRTGALMANGDFLEGDVKSLKDGTVSVSSILFGMRKVRIYDDLTAVVLHDVSPEKTPFTLTTTDGSLYRAKSLKPDQQNVLIEDASLGEVSIPVGALAQLRVQ